MAKTQTKFEQFLYGQKWAAKHARLSLPILVRRVEQQRGTPGGEVSEFTYADLAVAVGQPNNARNISASLGTLGHALKELEEKQQPSLGKIPPIQLLVWSKGKESPGDSAFNFLSVSKAKLQSLSEDARQALARDTRAQILKYPHWRKVLAALGLKPLTLDLPSATAVVASPSKDRFGGGESPEHKRLKHYLATHYEKLGIKGKFKANFEEALLSGDKADLMLDEIQGVRRYCVEVKSCVSNDNEGDLIRGLFQCVKYRSVLLGHEKYEGAKSVNYTSKAIDVILATEKELPEALKRLAELLNVCVVAVPVRKDYQAPV